MSANAAMVNMLQDRLSSLVNSPSGYVESLPKPIKRRVTALKGIQAQQGELENQFHKEVFALEKKYAGLFQPLYDRRSELIAGSGALPTEEEMKMGKDAEASFGFSVEGDDEEVAAEKEQKGDEANGVPDFWLKTLKNHPRFADLITELDEEPLRALTDIRMSYLPDETPGFRLSFHFAENEHFSNEVLVKTYYYQAEAVGGELLYDRAEGTKVDWKPGKDLSIRVELKRQRHKGTGKTREVKKAIPVDSFFNFFSPPRVPDDAENADDEEQNAELEERLEFDYELGEEMKEKVIPHAVDWFTGRALLYEPIDEPYDEDEGEFEGDDDDDESDDEDEEDEEDDSDKAPPKDEKPPECKQQ